MEKRIVKVVSVIIAVFGLSFGAMIFTEPAKACNECTVTETERKCAKCGGFLKSDPRSKDGNESEYKNGKLYSYYKCEKCSHECTVVQKIGGRIIEIK